MGTSFCRDNAVTSEHWAFSKVQKWKNYPLTHLGSMVFYLTLIEYFHILQVPQVVQQFLDAEISTKERDRK